MINRPEHDNTQYFIGSEVEHTPAFSTKTLFVIGARPIAEILAIAKENGVAHVFLTANQSFDIDVDYSSSARKLLAEGYFVTIDYPAEHHGALLNALDSDVWRHRKFIPLVSCKLNNLDKCGNNLTVKIDDSFKGSNGGVWCWDKQALLDNNRFTSWGEYAADAVVDLDDSPVDMLDTVTETLVGLKDALVDNLKDIVGQVAEKFTPGEITPHEELSEADKVYQDALAEQAVAAPELNNNELGLEPDISTSTEVVSDDVAKTTSASLDGSEAVVEPELVAKKSTKAKK